MKKTVVVSLVGLALFSQGCISLDQGNQKFISSKLNQISKTVDRKMNHLDTSIGKRLTKIENNVDRRLTKVEENVDSRLTSVENSVDSKIANLSKQQENQVASKVVKSNKKYSVTAEVSTTINDTVHKITEQLLSTLSKEEASSNAIAITSFVDLHNLNTTTHFGRVIAESFFNELNARKLQVIDLRAQKALSVTQDGEFFLSRDVNKLRSKIINKYVLVGTYSRVAEGVIVNSRIVSNEDGSVVASSRVIFHSDDCELFENCKEPDPVQIVPESTLDITAG